MRKLKLSLGLAAVVSLLFAATAQAKPPAGWEEFRSDEYGFQMLIPVGTTLVPRAFDDGWAGLYAKYGDNEVFAVTKKGATPTRQQIEAFGVIITGIPGEHWKLLRAAKNTLGFKWFRTVKAQKGDVALFARYGEGPKGPYIVFLKASASQVKKHPFIYGAWANSVRVF